jgi:protein-tyrosine phosphatase
MKVLMVCLGNICRSPMAEGILRELARQEMREIIVDSAGTSDYHVGEAPDPRAQAELRRRGIEIGHLRGRQFTPQDFHEFDLLLAMDTANLRNMRRMAPGPELTAKARLIMDLVPEHPLREVPDPYYGGDEGFTNVYDMLVMACRNLLVHVHR